MKNAPFIWTQCWTDRIDLLNMMIRVPGNCDINRAVRYCLTAKHPLLDDFQVSKIVSVRPFGNNLKSSNGAYFDGQPDSWEIVLAFEHRGPLQDIADLVEKACE